MHLMLILTPPLQRAGMREDTVCDITRPNEATPFIGPSHVMVRSSRALHGGYGACRGVGSIFASVGGFGPCHSNRWDAVRAGAAHHVGAC